MPTPKQPEKRSELRPPPSAGQSAPPPSVKGPSRSKSSRMPAATELSDTRAGARASSASAIDRADGLLRQMTIEEKAMQLSSVFPLALFDTEGTNRSQLDALLKHGIGHVSALGLIGHKTPETLAKSVNAIQRYLVTETRLKIPAIFHNEAMSGVVAPHFTAFPTSIGLAATWDPAAVEGDGRHHPAPDAGGGPAPGAGAGHGRGPRCPLGTGERDLRRGSLPRQRHERRLHARDAGKGPDQGRAGDREALRRLRGDRRRPEHGGDRGRRAGALRRPRPSFRGCIQARRARVGDAELLGVRWRADLGVPRGADRPVARPDGLHGDGRVRLRRRRVACTRASRSPEPPEEAGLLALAAGMDVETPAVYGYGQVLAKAVREREGARVRCWTSPCAACCATSLPSACSTTRTSPRTRSRSEPSRARAPTSPGGSPPHR